MANTADNVFVGVTGSVLYGLTSATLPATLTATTTGFTDLGYVDEEGITETQPTDTNEVKAWQNGDIVRRIQTSHELTYAFGLLETSTAVQTLVYGGVGTSGTPLELTGDPLSRHAFVIDILDDTKKRRICIPNAEITERPEVVYANSDPAKYAVTITCYPDATGVKAYVYEGTTA